MIFEVTLQPCQRLEDQTHLRPVRIIFSDIAVADEPPHVDDKCRRAGDSLFGMEHTEKIDDPPLHVGNQPELYAELAQRLQNRHRIVRADSHNFGVLLGNFFRKFLEPNQLPLTKASEMTAVKNEENIFLPHQLLRIKPLDIKLRGLPAHPHRTGGRKHRGRQPTGEENEQYKSYGYPLRSPSISFHPRPVLRKSQ